MELKNGFSVLIAAYHKDNPLWLKEALESVYDKQTVKPSEVVLVKDGPLTDKLENVIRDFATKLGDRFKIVSLPKNMGLHIALNEGLKHCKFNWVARMDADDICLPNRFELQLRAIERNPNIAVIGGYIEEFDPYTKKVYGIRKVPLSSEEIKRFAKIRSPFNHMTVMFKKDIILKEGGYPPFRLLEDYALWVKLIVNGYTMINIPEVLVKARAGDNLIKKRQGIEYFLNKLKLEKYFKNLGFYNTYEAIFYGTAILIPHILPKFMLKSIYRNFLRKKINNHHK